MTSFPLSSLPFLSVSFSMPIIAVLVEDENKNMRDVDYVLMKLPFLPYGERTKMHE